MADKSQPKDKQPKFKDVTIEGKKFREITIKGQRFRIGVFSPAVGSRILLQLPVMLANETIYDSVRRSVLDVVYQFVSPEPGDAPLKIFHKGASADEDEWAVSELEGGIQTALVLETTNFNFDPTAGESKAAIESPAQRTSSQPQSPKA